MFSRIPKEKVDDDDENDVELAAVKNRSNFNLERILEKSEDAASVVTFRNPASSLYRGAHRRRQVAPVGHSEGEKHVGSIENPYQQNGDHSPQNEQFTDILIRNLRIPFVLLIILVFWGPLVMQSKEKGTTPERKLSGMFKRNHPRRPDEQEEISRNEGEPKIGFVTDNPILNALGEVKDAGYELPLMVPGDAEGDLGLNNVGLESSGKNESRTEGEADGKRNSVDNESTKSNRTMSPLEQYQVRSRQEERVQLQHYEAGNDGIDVDESPLARDKGDDDVFPDNEEVQELPKQPDGASKYDLPPPFVDGKWKPKLKETSSPFVQKEFNNHWHNMDAQQGPQRQWQQPQFTYQEGVQQQWQQQYQIQPRDHSPNLMVPNFSYRPADRQGLIPRHFEDRFADIWDPILPTDTPLFWHIPKNGGTTVSDILTHCVDLVSASNIGASEGHAQDTALQVRTYHDQGRYINVDTASIPGLKHAKELGLAASGLADVIIIHRLHEGSELFDSGHRARVFSMFRNPVHRAVSMFYYLQRAKWEPTYDPTLADMSLLDYANSKKVEENWVTRFLVHQYTGRLTQDDVDQAKQVMRNKMIVGLLDNFQESLKRFEVYFDWWRVNKEKGYVPRMVQCQQNHAHSAQNRVTHPIPDENDPAYRRLLQLNWADMQLYQYAQQLFVEQEELIKDRDSSLL